MRGLAVALAVLALAVRLLALGEAPPGIHVDAAANAWSARCLAATGTDWNGAPWPILYSRGFGENQSTLYYYLLLPFQALFGMSAWSTALPSVVGGAASVFFAFVLGKRLFDPATGLAAAAILAASPWHLLLSRWGHDSGVVPLLVLAPLAMFSASGLPLGDRSPGAPRIGTAAAAGVCLGICCYGYYAVRLFLPALLLAATAAQPADWRRVLGTRRGRLALGAFLLGTGLTLGPLAASHLLDPETSKRATVMLLWSESDGPGARAAKVLARYAAHFSPGFLFREGDTFLLHVIPGSAPLLLSMLPFAVLGAFFVLKRVRSSAGARLVAAWIVLYPVADAFSRHPTPNLLRSSPGLIGFAFLTAVGVAGLLRRFPTRALTAALALVLLADTALATRRFFQGFRTRPDLQHAFNADLLEAAERLRPRLPHVDAVFVSTKASAAQGQPFVVFLVGLDYPPEDWFRQPRRIERRADTDLVHGFGKIFFLLTETDVDAMRALERDGRPQRVLFVARPGEIPREEAFEIVPGPDGTPAFLLVETTL